MAKAIDTLLGALQAVYNFILDAVNFIVAGLIKIIQGLANLASAAMEMPDNFMGQISEEFLGMDVTQPLPFEKSGAINTATPNEASSTEMDNLLTKETYEEDDFHVEPFDNDMELSPELLSQLSDKTGEHSFGKNDNTMDGFKEQFNTSSTEDATVAPTKDPKDDVPVDAYAQANWFINYQNSQAKPDTSADNANGKEAATAASMPEDMKLVGPWSPGVRMYYLKEQMMDGISKKWSENKAKYITIGALVVLGITALALATAGAIFALIPPALQIMAALMMGAALLKATGFFKDYMTDGWAGNIASAGKALARAIGIILVELIFILLFDSAALFKVLKTAAKSGVKGVVNLAKVGVKTTLKAGKFALIRTGRGLVKQAGKVKFFVQGIGKGIAKGAKSLDELGENLAKRFQFKGFKIVVKGFRFYLYGSINPWVLLASGEVKKVKKSEIEPEAKINTKLKIYGEDAVYIGKHKPNIDSDIAKAFLDSGFSIDDISVLVNQRKGIEIASMLSKSEGYTKKQIVELVQRANKYGLNVQIERILKTGKLDNPDKLKRMLSELDDLEPKLGNYNELNIADDITSSGKKAEFDTQGDIVNLSDKIVYQAKRVESPNKDAVFHNIESADKQLAHMNSEGTARKIAGMEEPLPGFQRHANIDIHNKTNELFDLSRKDLLKELNEAVANGRISFKQSPLGDGLATHKVIIKNGKGSFEFIIKEGNFI